MMTVELTNHIDIPLRLDTFDLGWQECVRLTWSRYVHNHTAIMKFLVLYGGSRALSVEQVNDNSVLYVDGTFIDTMPTTEQGRLLEMFVAQEETGRQIVIL